MSRARTELRIASVLIVFVCSLSSGQEAKTSISVPLLSPNTRPSGGYTLATLSNFDGNIDLHTTFVDWIEDEAFVLSVNNDLSPKSCVAFGNAFDLISQDIEPTPVAFMFKPKGVLVEHKYWGRKGRPEEVTDYGLPLSQLVEGVARKDLGSDWSVAQELYVCDSGSFFVTYRMPAEARFFGHPVLACLAFPPNGQRQWYTCINGSGVLYGRVHHPNVEFDPASDNPKWLTKEACRELFLHDQYGPELSIYSDAIYRMAASSTEMSAKKLAIHQAHERERLCYELMLRIRESFDVVLTDGTSLFLDPHVRGMMVEQALWQPDRHTATVDSLLAIILNDLESSSGELSLSYSLRCAIADLGFCPSETSHAVLLESAQGRAFSDRDSAAVLARWRFPTEQRHINATVEFIQNAKHLTDKFNCVETLILLGRLDLIPADSMNRWFDEIKVDANQFRRPLNLLMQNPMGRRYLVDRYKAMPIDAPLREPIKSLFTNELSVVHEFGDYRFWTKDECRRLESDLRLKISSDVDSRD